ncbi:MAG: sialate O-acetylesterase [Bryobacteraceae bacterium]|nr:sialate O-acetylesterase [Bryobacteraceae bacterium]
MRILPLMLVAVLAAGQSLRIESGAADYQVFQRGPANTADIRVEGSVQGADGRAIEARVLRQGMELAGFEWKAAGKVSGGRWWAELKGLPAGGPYKLEFRTAGSRDVAAVAHVLVGDLWVLAGQSNMEGVGNLEELPLPSALVNSLDMTDTWVVAEDPLHRLVDAADRVHWRKNAKGEIARLEGEELRKWIAARRKGAGAGLPFALEMVRRTGVPVGLIPCAHGGTSMDQWSPELKDRGGDSLYGAMLRRIRLAGGRVRGVLWYQGESDANEKAAPLFEEKFRRFIQALRQDTGQRDLPFYYVQIGRHVANAPGGPWDMVQDAQLRVESQLPNVWMTTCVDCELDDGIHVGTDDLRLLGVRLANLAEGRLRRGPRPVAARLRGQVIEVEFSEVNGRLVHAGRLNGFSIRDAAGNELPLVYRQRVSREAPHVVELLIQGKLPEDAVLYYGAGRNPYVNVRDEAGMAAPAFGPMKIER